MAEITKVAIVNAGRHRSLSAGAGDYDALASTMEDCLGRLKRDRRPLADVCVVRTTEQALAHVGHRGTIFYLTMGMADDAEKVAKEHSQIRVVVLTGDPITGVVYLNKGWNTLRLWENLAVLRGF